MKRIFVIALGATLLLMTSCRSNTQVKQISKDILVGQSYYANELFTTQKEGVTFRTNEDKIQADTLGKYDVKLIINETDEEHTYTFNVVDKTAPIINQINTKLVVGESFIIQDFIEVYDNYDTDDNVKINVVSNDINESELGEYTVKVSAKDSSGNEKIEEILISVVDRIIQVKKGEVINSKWDSNEVELTIKSISFEQKVKSKSDNMFSYEFIDEPGEKYIVVKTIIKNLGGTAISEQIIQDNWTNITDPLEVVFDEKYTYPMQQVDITNMVLSGFYSIQPLKSLEVYFVVSVPDELTSKPYKVFFSIGENSYYYEN